MARNWWPVAVWLGVIRLESTDLASARNTSGLLFATLRFFFPHLPRWYAWYLDAVLRKMGHFVGYAILGGLVFFALRNTYRDRVKPFLRRPWGVYLRDYWRWEWVWIGMLATIITASFDEIHQTFIPSRTGRWQDVVIDASGAAVLQALLYLLSVRQLNRERKQVRQSELETAS